MGSRHGSPIIIRARRRTGVSGQQLQVTPARCRQKLWRRRRGTAVGAWASGWSPPSAIKMASGRRVPHGVKMAPASVGRAEHVSLPPSVCQIRACPSARRSKTTNEPLPQRLSAAWRRSEAGKSERNSEPHHRPPIAPWVAWQRALLLFLAGCFGGLSLRCRS